MRLHCDVKHGHLQRLKPGMLTKPALSRPKSSHSSSRSRPQIQDKIQTLFEHVFSSVLIVLVFVLVPCIGGIFRSVRLPVVCNVVALIVFNYFIV